MSKFAWPRDEKSANALLKDFFSEVNFVKRVKLHQQHMCKSKLKQTTLITLYYKQIVPREIVNNLIMRPNVAEELNGKKPNAYDLLQKFVKTEQE